MARRNLAKIRHLLRNYRIRDAYESIVKEGTPDDETLTLFQRVLGINWNLFKLDDFAAQMEQYAQEGDPWFQYAWARYNDATRPLEDSVDIAIDNYTKAADAGIPDALMCLAYLWNEGEFGLVDREKYDEYLQKAVDAGSDMALLQQLRDAIWGNNGQNKDPHLVYDTATQYIEEIESSGEDIDPRYYSIVGSACEELGRSLEAYTWYEKAFDAGDPKACLKMAILAGGLDDDGYIIRIDDYMKIIAKGVNMQIANCELYIAFTNVENHMATLSEKEQIYYRNETAQHFKNAYTLGNGDGAFYLGDCWHNGRYGFPRDLQKSWEWYMRGAFLNNCLCYHRMADMILEGEAPRNFSDDDFLYKCELLALRYGDDDSLINVVMAYRQGHLKEYAEEIEKYYVPEFEERYEFDDDEFDERGLS